MALTISFVWIDRYELWMAGTTLFLSTLAFLFSPTDRLLPRAVHRTGALFLILIGLYGITLWGHAATSDIPALSILQAGFYTLPLLVALTLMTTDRDVMPLGMLLRGGYMLFIFLAMAAGVQVAVFDMPNNDRAAWPLTDANHLAMVMNVGIIFAYGLMMTPTWRRPGLILFVLCITALFLTGSRGGLLAIVLTTPLLLFLYRKTWPFTRRQALSGLAGIAAIGLILMQIRVGESSALYTFREIITDPTGFMSSRPTMWAAIWELIKQRPFAGYGTGTFPAVYPHVMTPAHLSGGFAAHNDFLQIWLELGAMGPVLYVAIGFVLLIGGLHALPRIENQNQHIQMISAIGGISVLFLHAQFEFMLGVLPLNMLAGLLIGLWWQALPGHQHHARPLTDRRTYWGGQVLGVALIMGSTLSLTQTYAEICLRYSDARLRQHDIAGFAMGVDAAQRWSLNLHAFPYLRAANFQLALLLSANPGLSANPESVQILIDKTRTRNPHLSAVWETQGRLDELKGHNPVPAWQKGLSIEPRNASLRLVLLKYYERMGMGDAARALAAASLEQWDLRGPRTDLNAALKRYSNK